MLSGACGAGAQTRACTMRECHSKVYSEWSAVRTQASSTRWAHQNTATKHALATKANACEPLEPKTFSQTHHKQIRPLGPNEKHRVYPFGVFRHKNLPL